MNPDNSQRGLIKTSLKTKETSWHGYESPSPVMLLNYMGLQFNSENRYLLFLTENYAALEILKQYLQDQEGGHPLLSVQSEESSLKPWEMEPFVLFGSSFPKDKEYTQVSLLLQHRVYVSLCVTKCFRRLCKCKCVFALYHHLNHFSLTSCFRSVEISTKSRFVWRLAGL